MMSEQMAWDAAAVVASFASCVFIFTRRRMLSGEHSRWHSASSLVQAVLGLQAIFMGCVAISIMSGAHASQRETLVYIVSAVVSIVMAANLDRNGRVERAD